MSPTGIPLTSHPHRTSPPATSCVHGQKTDGSDLGEFVIQPNSSRPRCWLPRADRGVPAGHSRGSVTAEMAGSGSEAILRLA